MPFLLLPQVTAHTDRPGYEPISSTLWRQREDYCARLIQSAWRKIHCPAESDPETASALYCTVLNFLKALTSLNDREHALNHVYYFKMKQVSETTEEGDDEDDNDSERLEDEKKPLKSSLKVILDDRVYL